ncbi:MAG TPA: CHAT domain-containing protein [Saprospiraceae bacterium]|nr:CHAT domain-containing protein [Saprospiraceae bacterium]HPI05839.1 CHAT domain-containing protein [Saprospiraceae bacterium]
MRKSFLLLFLCSPMLLVGQHPDSTDLKMVDSLIRACRPLILNGDFDEALRIGSVAEKIALEKWGQESPPYARCCYNHGRILYFNADYPGAEKWYLDAKIIQEKTGVTESPEYAWTLNNLGILYNDQSEYTRAEPYFLESKKIRERVLGKKHNDYASSLNNLGVLYLDMGDYEKTLACLLEALSIREQLFGRQNASFASSLDNLAITYQHMGDYEKAEPLYLEARRIREVKPGKTHADYASSLNNLGIFYFNLGNYEEAERLYKEAIDIREKVLGKEHPTYLITLNNLANLYEVTGQYDRAETLYKESLAIRAQKPGKEHADYAGGLQSLAILYTDRKQYEKAEPLLLEAKGIRERINGVNHPEYAGLLNNLAHVYTGENEYAKAESCYLQSKEIRKNTLGIRHPEYLESLQSLTDFYWQTNRLKTASEYLLETGRAENDLLAKASRHLSERELSLYIRKFEYALDRNFSFARYQSGLEGMCFDDILFYKGFLLNASAKISNLTSTDSSTTEMLQLLKSYGRRLAAEYAKPLAEQQDVEDLERKADNLNKNLTRAVSEFGRATRQITWQEVQQKLQPGEAAIEFVHYHVVNPQPTDSTMYAALILLPGKNPVFVPLFEEKQLDALLRNTGKSKPEQIDALYSGNSLYELIWRPLEPQLAGIKTVYFSPSGLLHRLNLGAALVHGKVLADRFHLIELNSTRQLAIADNVISENREAILYGGIQYDLDRLAFSRTVEGMNAGSLASPRGLNFTSTDSTLRAGTWNYLKWTEVEVGATEAVLLDAGFRPTVLRKYAASEESFKSVGSAQSSPHILHVATHGFFFPDPKQAQNSKSNDQDPVFKISDHPMMRAGLVLAGGNYAWKNGKPFRPGLEDGILTAYEISQMNLRSTELVVLSACETGLGDIQGNEGVYGLQRAFKIAGAQYLIMSLWQVPDFHSQELMTAFYSRWITDKMSIPDAFDAAQKTMREKYKDPFLWAGFILVK